MSRSHFALLLLPCLVACGAFEGGPREDAYPLVDMEEPLALFTEPDDEAARQDLPKGTFSGLAVQAAGSLDDLDDGGGGLLVTRIVENSPAALAGLEKGDILFEAKRADQTIELRHASEWRRLELESEPGTDVTLVYDRANREQQAVLRLVRRVRSPERHEVERFREEQKVGVVLRTATEVEARRFGLGPGAGAVVVGLSQRSPWRDAGIGFGDVIVRVEDREVTHPRVVLEVLRNADGDVALELGRGEERIEVSAATSRRETEVDDVYVPLLFSYQKGRGNLSWSALLSIFSYESTEASWQFRFLWLIRFGGGDADRLIEESGS